jgi:hypothetical protein
VEQREVGRSGLKASARFIAAQEQLNLLRTRMDTWKQLSSSLLPHQNFDKVERLQGFAVEHGHLPES